MDNTGTLFNISSLSSSASSPVARYVMIAIVAVFTIGILLFWYFRPQATMVTAMGPYVLGEGSGATETLFTQSQIASSLGNNFSLGFFVYIDDASRERIGIGRQLDELQLQPIITVLGLGDIVINPIYQTLTVRVRSLHSGGLTDPNATVLLTIDNFMVGRWNQVLITLEGRSLDVYLNGAIANSTLLDNLPILNPVGVLLNTSPEFTGQAGLVQGWPYRLTESDVIANYKRNTTTRGKPLIPDIQLSLTDIWSSFLRGLCDVGFCVNGLKTNAAEYIDYEYA